MSRPANRRQNRRAAYQSTINEIRDLAFRAVTPEQRATINGHADTLAAIGSGTSRRTRDCAPIYLALARECAAGIVPPAMVI